jgi:hypothetical protein
MMNCPSRHHNAGEPKGDGSRSFGRHLPEAKKTKVLGEGIRGQVSIFGVACVQAPKPQRGQSTGFLNQGAIPRGFVLAASQ